jgi:hypothetical protein
MIDLMLDDLCSKPGICFDARLQFGSLIANLDALVTLARAWTAEK